MVRPKKHLGQHFLHDENIARKILASVPTEPRLVLEVGPGTGVLSKYLLEDETHDSFFLEVDRESAGYLRKKFPAIIPKLIQADFLDYPLDSFPEACRSLEPMTLLGNFPYNISSQILFKAIEYRSRVRTIVGMFQKEVAERLTEPPGSRTYGILSVILQAFYDTEYLMTVSPAVFIPPPNVKSAVIRLIRNSRESLGCDEKLFVKVVKTAFNQRRKTLHNALKPLTALVERKGRPASSLIRAVKGLSVGDFILLTSEIGQRQT